MQVVYKSLELRSVTLNDVLLQDWKLSLGLQPVVIFLNDLIWW